MLRSRPFAIAQERQLQQRGGAGGHGTADGFDRLTTLAGPRRVPRSGVRRSGLQVRSDRDATYAQGSVRASVSGAADFAQPLYPPMRAAFNPERRATLLEAIEPASSDVGILHAQ